MKFDMITKLFRKRGTSAFAELISGHMVHLPQQQAQALLSIFLYAHRKINGTPLPARDIEILKLTLSNILRECDTGLLTDNAEKTAAGENIFPSAAMLRDLPQGEKLQIAADILKLDQAVTPLEEEKLRFVESLAEAIGLSQGRIQELFESDAARRDTAAKVINSGTGLAVALVVILVFLLAATFLKSLVFGMILAYFFLPLEKFFERFFKTKFVTAIAAGFDWLLYPFRKLSGLFSKKVETEEQKALNSRRMLVMKSSVAALISIVLAGLLLLILTISILIPFAIETGRSVNAWADKSPFLEQLENTISDLFKPETNTVPDAVPKAENMESKVSAEPVKTETDTVADAAPKAKNAADKPEIHSFKEFIEWLCPSLQTYIKKNSQSIASAAVAKGKGIAATLFTAAASFGSFMFNMLLSVFFFLYFMQKMAFFSSSFKEAASGESAGDWCVKSIFESGWMPKTSEASRKEAADIINRICLMFAGWIRGYISIILIETILYITAFSIFSVPYAIPLGFAAGLTILLPFIGLLSSFVLTSLICIAFVNANLATTLIGVVLTYLIVNGILEQLILYPALVGGAIGLTTLETIIVVLLGGLFAGIPGMILAVPAAAVIKYLVPKIYNVWFPHRN